MVAPDNFDVVYSINPHMINHDGELHKVDKKLAKLQWTKLKETFEGLNYPVEVLDHQPGYPDMVFCANQCFPFRSGPNQNLQIVLSKMANEPRRGEVRFFEEWAQDKGHETHHIQAQKFEGCGDALLNLFTGEIWGGFGFRTSVNAYDELEKITHRKVHRLKLIHEKFYHLDTCLAFLSHDSALYAPQAFDEESKLLLKKSIPKLYPVDNEEAKKSMPCNCFCPNGKDVIIEAKATSTISLLKEKGFQVHPVETSEFIKAGGSVFCLKQAIPV